jgi:hypothetical protein
MIQAGLLVLIQIVFSERIYTTAANIRNLLYSNGVGAEQVDRVNQALSMISNQASWFCTTQIVIVGMTSAFLIRLIKKNWPNPANGTL